MSIHKTMRGQTMIEVLVALTTMVVIISAITVAVISALRNAEFSRTQNSATRYAQEGMEFVRFLRDSNYPQFLALTQNTTYCLNKGKSSLESKNEEFCRENVDFFSRTIKLEDNSPYCASTTPAPPVHTTRKVTVVVAWTDAQCIDSAGDSTGMCHESKLVSCLSDYTIVATPGVNVTNTPTPTPG